MDKQRTTTHLKTDSACLLGISTVQTLIVSLPRRHSSLVLRCCIRRARGLRTISTTVDGSGEDGGGDFMAVIGPGHGWPARLMVGVEDILVFALERKSRGCSKKIGETRIDHSFAMKAMTTVVTAILAGEGELRQSSGQEEQKLRSCHDPVTVQSLPDISLDQYINEHFTAGLDRRYACFRHGDTRCRCRESCSVVDRAHSIPLASSILHVKDGQPRPATAPCRSIRRRVTRLEDRVWTKMWGDIDNMGLEQLPDELLMSMSEQWPCREREIRQLSALVSVSCGSTHGRSID